jgi:hypothetical protein
MVVMRLKSDDFSDFVMLRKSFHGFKPGCRNGKWDFQPDYVQLVLSLAGIADSLSTPQIAVTAPRLSLTKQRKQRPSTSLSRQAY